MADHPKMESGELASTDGPKMESGERASTDGPKMESGERASTDGIDARDGLTRLERVILWQLREAQRELGRDSVPTALLYGRVVEKINVSVEQFQRVLQRFVGAGVKRHR